MSGGKRLRAIFNDGILCDGFIWKYLWNDLAGLCDVAHWHYRGHGRSAAPADPSKIDIAHISGTKVERQAYAVVQGKAKYQDVVLDLLKKSS